MLDRVEENTQEFVQNYLGQWAALEHERQTLERDFEARLAQLEARKLRLEGEGQDELRLALERQGGPLTFAGVTAQLERRPERWRVSDETQVLAWLELHAPHLLMRRVNTARLQAWIRENSPEGAPGLERVPENVCLRLELNET